MQSFKKKSAKNLESSPFNKNMNFNLEQALYHNNRSISIIPKKPNYSPS